MVADVHRVVVVVGIASSVGNLVVLLECPSRNCGRGDRYGSR
jgi:hypothetical protein